MTVLLMYRGSIIIHASICLMTFLAGLLGWSTKGSGSTVGAELSVSSLPDDADTVDAM
jgi:hypothetical protein